MKAVIMAGGNGKRLRPLTCTMPKPMARVCDKPVLEYILELLAANGADEAVLTLSYMPQEILRFIETRRFGTMKVRAVVEEKMLGTAGSVKNAARDFDEDFLVISGDAMCDFALQKIYKYHVAKGAAATVVCSKVEDPREYGLVEAEPAGNITGFLEKPDWGQIASASANTGIYVLNPKCLSLIPDDEPFDFAKDLFPRMLQKEMQLFRYQAEGYWCDIGSIEAYRNCQADLLCGKMQGGPQRVAQGIYVKDALPKGNYQILPPAYIGANVEIGDGAVIGPYAVLEDGCSVGENSKVRRSVLLRCAMVGRDCTLNKALVCESATLKRGAGMYENSVLGAFSVAEENAVLSADIAVWPNKIVPRGTVLSESIKYGSERTDVFTEDGICGTLGVEITPARCAMLGEAVGSCAFGKRVGLATDNTPQAKAAAYSIAGGLMASGSHVWNFSECFLSQLYFYTAFCSLGAGIFVSCKDNKTAVQICGEGGLSLPRSAGREIESRLQRREFNRCSGTDCRDISDMTSIAVMYQREMARQVSGRLSGIGITVQSENEQIICLLEDCLCRLGCRKGADLILHINAQGTELSAYESGFGSISADKLLGICCLHTLKNGHDVAIPYDTPHAIDRLAGEYGRRVHRYVKNPAEPRDKEATAIALKQIWARDALFMAVKLLSIMGESGENLSELSAELPEFYIARRAVEIAFPPSLLLEAFRAETDAQAGAEGVCVKTGIGRAYVIPTRTGKTIRIMAETSREETAEALCEEVEKRLLKLQKD